ncbi:MAG: hypothetical protein ABR987_06485 [Terracidiphilus sp.]|jgi:hypothetical protein
MEQRFPWSWVETQVAETVGEWNRCALPPSLPPSVRYTTKEQRTHEKAYDDGLRAVQREGRRMPRNATERMVMQQRIVALFPRFASIALGLDGDETGLITDHFLPMGTELARWTRRFDRSLSNADTIQACRNAWTCCGLQALLGKPMELTPSILAYSLLYPYSDNYLDRPGLSTADKLEFSGRFRKRLCGDTLAPRSPHEASVWTMVQLIEEQYPRQHYPQVYDCLLAIHRAQEASIAQLNTRHNIKNSLDNSELLRISCAKGGTSVLADACLTQPVLHPDEIRLAFEWGVLLQLGDDLQDVREDLRRGSITLFTRAVAQGKPLDSLILQLLHFSDQIAGRMDRMPRGASSMKSLLRMSWRSLILMAVADVQRYCSPAFLAALEPCSSFRFKFLRDRNQSLTGREALYDLLFDAFVEAGPGERSRLPLPGIALSSPDHHPIAEMRALSNSFA